MSIFTQEQLEQIRAIVREELQRTETKALTVNAGSVKAEDLKRALDAARDGVIRRMKRGESLL